MSLEQALAANTAALTQVAELLARMNASQVLTITGDGTGEPLPVYPTEPAAEVAAPAGKPAATAKPKAAPATAKPTAAAAPTPVAALAPTPSPVAALPAASYEDVKKAVLSVVQSCGREAAVAMLAEFGVAKSPELKPEQYTAVCTSAAALIEAATV